MAAEDQRVRAELAASGALFSGGYHPVMERVHRAHAARLRTILSEQGWPDRHLVGVDGADAAWRIVQHAIGEPELQRAVLPLLEAAIARGTVPPQQAAYLEDRIRFFEDRPQRYGTQLDWDEGGQLTPMPGIEDEPNVDARRRAVGVEPLASALRRGRAAAEAENDRAPADLAERRRDMAAWARRVGWRT
jgi:hypothetical protein